MSESLWTAMIGLGAIWLVGCILVLLRDAWRTTRCSALSESQIRAAINREHNREFRTGVPSERGQ